MSVEEDAQIIQSYVAPVTVSTESVPVATLSPTVAPPVPSASPAPAVSPSSPPTASLALTSSDFVFPDTGPLKADLVIEFDTANGQILLSGPVVAAMPGNRSLIRGPGPRAQDYGDLATEVADRMFDIRARNVFRFADDAPDDLKYIRLTAASRRLVLSEFARLGKSMYITLFGGSPLALKALGELRKRERPRVYIKSPDGYLPWALMYDGPSSSLAPENVDAQSFWGSRYSVSGVPVQTEQRPITRELAINRWSLLLGFYAGDETPFPTYRKTQREYWHPPARPAPVVETTSENDFIKQLAGNAKALTSVYVFAHGQNGLTKVEARYKDTDRIVQFTRPDPHEVMIRFSPLRDVRPGLTPRDILLLNVDFNTQLDGALVFLNVCNGESTGAISQRNFVPAFLSVGAGAVIATDAEMDQALAAAAARDFFDQIASTGKGDTTLADLMLWLRLKYLRENPLVYAYTLWGNGVVKR